MRLASSGVAPWFARFDLEHMPCQRANGGESRPSTGSGFARAGRAAVLSARGPRGGTAPANLSRRSHADLDVRPPSEAIQPMLPDARHLLHVDTLVDGVFHLVERGKRRRSTLEYLHDHDRSREADWT